MYLGLDIGTSGVKAVLVDESQTVIDQATGPLSISRPKPLSRYGRSKTLEIGGVLQIKLSLNWIDASVVLLRPLVCQDKCMVLLV